jgi:hypothetical protein
MRLHASATALARNWVVHFGVITTLPLTSIFCVLLTMTSILEDFNSTVIMLTAAAECCDSHEQKKVFLLTKAEETYWRLRLVWPQPNGMKPCLPVYDSCPLANEYYMHSIPNTGLHYLSDRTNHGIRVLFLAKSHCDTPPQLLGKLLYLTQFSDEMERSICETIHPGIFHGHINLVHCLSYMGKAGC